MNFCHEVKYIGARHHIIFTVHGYTVQTDWHIYSADIQSTNVFVRGDLQLVEVVHSPDKYPTATKSGTPRTSMVRC